MSDLSDLEGIFPNSLRWNAEDGRLSISAYDAEAGERGLQEIDLGPDATFVMDMATRTRGYGLIKTGIFDMQLTPVGSPPPPNPAGEYKPALGVSTWHPQYGELRLETNGAIFRDAVQALWDNTRFKPEAAEGQQPVVRFVDRVPRYIKKVNKSFLAPVIEIIGWAERDAIPGWKERPATVPTPKALPLLPASSTPGQSTAPSAMKPLARNPSPADAQPLKGGRGRMTITSGRTARGRGSARDELTKRGPDLGSNRNDPDDPVDDILGGDPIPFK
jgi:hypothetical protein